MSEPVDTVTDRILAVDGLVNVRDLGGLSTTTGGRVRTGRVIRSDNLRGLSPTGAAALMDDYGIRLVVDLRTVEECEREGISPLTGPGHQYVNLPLVPQSAITEDQIAAGFPTNLVDDYLAHLQVSPLSIVAALGLLADPANLPAVVHCTAGKDRTGVVVAILLDLLGVPAEEIVADYAATAPAMEIVLARIQASPFFKSTGLADAPAWIFEAKPETMRRYLELLHERFGGGEAWALAHGLEPTVPGRLRAALVTAAVPTSD